MTQIKKIRLGEYSGSDELSLENITQVLNSVEELLTMIKNYLDAMANDDCRRNWNEEGDDIFF